MSQRVTKVLLVVLGVLLAAHILSNGQGAARAQQIGQLAKLPAHGACIGVIAEGGVLFRAFADGTVEAYKIGSGQSDWRPVTTVTLPPDKK